jgi:two-component system sensor histidine kinase DctS
MPYWPPESAGEAMQRSRRGLAGLAPREGYEAQWRHADGHPIEVMVFESPLVDAQGQQIGWMGSIIDITSASGWRSASATRPRPWPTRPG